ncbi:MAG TPA: HU family DNA-binding protein [Oscillatoriales cyanobacterium M59_W2019_021]|nr:MAG: HU family DNA-binding protein [Cyanobacteria bacterium J055]HIK33702.1 HU family DNA-binding protein [Oscillatoriales cyanobacterium M4454_W2019_049]HIK53118.1 HU family DNA-binding protein [Oscillatoriales cyanobacterium M59_W2019_021]
MNKADLVAVTAAKTGKTKKDVDSILTARVEEISGAVADGEKVTLVGFGSFESRTRKARTGRNPATGEKMEIPETRVPLLGAGKQFKDLVCAITPGGIRHRLDRCNP